MGCVCGKSGDVNDSDPRFNRSNLKVVDRPEALINFFSVSDDPRPKCVFVLGGSGSGKGEFIWDLMEKQGDMSSNREFSLAVINMDRLIAINIKQRILDLVEEGNNFTVKEIAKEEIVEANPEIDKSSLVKDEEECVEQESYFKIKSVKTYLEEFCKVVTCTWVFRLINEEMVRVSESFPEQKLIFLVSLLPNQISLFKRCLFLTQTPVLYEFPFQFIAINLVRGDPLRKDKDLTSLSSFADDVNIMYVNYFRSIHKLIDVISATNFTHRRLKVRTTCDVSSDPRYRKVCNQMEVTDMLRRQHLTGSVHVNISDLPASPTHFGTSSKLVFAVENKVEVDQNILIELDSTTPDTSKIRTLIQYLKTARETIESERNDQRNNLASSPKSPLSWWSFSDR